jgi:hypothetical protein
MQGQAVDHELPTQGTPPPRPTALTPEQLQFERQRPVRWYDPSVLLSAGLHVGITHVFGSFLDKRELQATAPAHVDTRFAGHDDGVWIDYVADTGDGFDATYAVASQVAARELTVDGCPMALPRAQVLVLGGDLVYPAASAENYENRLGGPLRAALPWTEEHHPSLFAIPGNHDWYDGLTGFLRLFGQGRWIGGWRTSQSRSYFAVQLPHRWWLWGVDIQFDMFIDAPQLEYFASVLDQMHRGDRLILATAVPTWVDLAGEPDAYRNLAYIERKLLRPRGIDLKLTVAGDLHHYSRYSDARDDPAVEADGRTSNTHDHDDLGPAHKITAGGGGAFLHPTHDLPRDVRITVDPDLADDAATFRARTKYPGVWRSRRLALGALLLPVRNPGFVWVPALLHLVLLWTNQFGIRSLSTADASYTRSAELSGWYDLMVGLVRNPAAFVLLAVLFAGLWAFARPPAALAPRWRPPARLAMAAVHTAAHVAAIVAVAIAGIRLASPLADGLPFALGASVAVAVLGGVTGSVVVGAYLAVANLVPRFHTHGNETLSAARVESCKSFLRMHVTGDGALEIHAIGIDRPPKRWRPDPDAADPESSWLLPAGRPCRPHLIETTTIR